MGNHLILPALSLLSIVITVGASIWIVRANCKNSYDWFLRVIISAAAVIFVFIAFPWGILSYYLRFVILLIFVIALVKSTVKLKDRAIFARSERKGRLKIYIKLALLAGLIVLNVLSIKPFFDDLPGAINLSFPLREGSFTVVQGGDSYVTNALHRLETDERYAIDLVKLNSYGSHSRGFFPERLIDYEIYGAKVYSPCSGKVVAAQSKIIDNYPGARNESNGEGNFIVIECNDLRVRFGHLKYNGIPVKPGDEVKIGRMVAQAGNSGDSCAPHLHMSVTKILPDGRLEPIPVTFNKIVPVINRLYVN